MPTFFGPFLRRFWDTMALFFLVSWSAHVLLTLLNFSPLSTVLFNIVLLLPAIFVCFCLLACYPVYVCVLYHPIGNNEQNCFCVYISFFFPLPFRRCLTTSPPAPRHPVLLPCVNGHAFSSVFFLLLVYLFVRVFCASAFVFLFVSFCSGSV